MSDYKLEWYLMTLLHATSNVTKHSTSIQKALLFVCISFEKSISLY